MGGRVYVVGAVIGRIELLARLPDAYCGPNNRPTKRWRVQCLNCGEIMDRYAGDIPRLTKGVGGKICSHIKPKDHVKDANPYIGTDSPCAAYIAKDKTTCAGWRECTRHQTWRKKAWQAAVDGILTAAGKEPKYGRR